jgi:hypothetical protein
MNDENSPEQSHCVLAEPYNEAEFVLMSAVHEMMRASDVTGHWVVGWDVSGSSDFLSCEQILYLLNHHHHYHDLIAGCYDFFRAELVKFSDRWR